MNDAIDSIEDIDGIEETVKIEISEVEKEPVFASTRTWVAIATAVMGIVVLLLKQFGIEVDQELLNSISTLIVLLGGLWIHSRTQRNTP